MKIKSLSLSLITIGLLLPLGVQAVLSATTPTAPVQTFEVLAFDASGDNQVTAKEIQAGQDKFLARPATLAEVGQPAQGLFVAQNSNYYVPATIQDLQNDDKDKNAVLSAEEADNANVKLVADHTTTAGKQFLISTFADNGIGVIRLVNDGSTIKVKLVPTIGGTPIKVYDIEMNKF